MASWIRARVAVDLLFVSGVGVGTVYATMWAFHKGRENAISTDVQSIEKEHSDHEKPQLVLSRPATAGGSETAETRRDRQENVLWAAKENLTSCSRSQRLLSGAPCGLPTYEDFKFEQKYGLVHNRIIFTRIHKGMITEVKLLQDDLMSTRFPLTFFVTVISDEKLNVGNEKHFMCQLNVPTIQENMSEEDIYNIISLEVDNTTVFDYEVKPNKVIDAEKLKKKCFKYLKKHGITREFLYFLTNTFLPEYKEAYYDEQIDQLADIIDDETV